MAEPNAKRQKVCEKEQTPASQDFERFAPDGDVVFIVNNKTRVRVHSVTMKMASPVFAAMLGPRFKEGQALVDAATNADAAPVEIALPEEQDAVCFGWICRALHCQTYTFLWGPNTEMLIKIWTIIEKYDMKNSMRLSVSSWVKRQIPARQNNTSDVWILALICFQNRDRSGFKYATAELFRRTKSSFFELASNMNENSCGLVATKDVFIIAGKLDKARNDAIDNARKFLYYELPECFDSNCCNDSVSTFDQQLTGYLSNNRSLLCSDISGGGISDVVSEIWKYVNDWECNCRCRDCFSALAQARDLLSKKTKFKISGLCLTCFDSKDAVCAKHKKE